MTSISEVSQLLDDYRIWLKDQTILRKVDDYVEITTPYLDRHNDHLQIYVRREKDGYYFTDDGATISDLEMSGCSLDSDKRRDLLRTTLAGFGVKHVDRALVYRATEQNFARAKHSIIQAMLAVNDLFYLSQPYIANLFLEDVISWLDSQDIRYTPSASFTGKTGYIHRFNFVIPKSKSAPERLLQAINNPTRDAAESLILAWDDTKETRTPGSTAYALFNDQDRKIGTGFEDALYNYEITPFKWSEREKYVEKLAV